MNKTYQLIVIGGGPAGLAAANAAWEKGLRSILIVERDKHLGGILNQCVHTGFGLHYFGEELSGPEYADRFIRCVQNTGIEVMTDTTVLRITREHDVHISSVAGYRILHSESIVLAMGCRERTGAAIGIPGTRPAGVFTAGAAQAYINLMGYAVGRRVVILGAGDIGLIMARRLTLEGAEVLACLEINSTPGGLARNVQQCLLDFDIPLLTCRTVTEIRGRERVTQVVSMAVSEGGQPIPGSEIVYDCDTLLLSVGLIPENELTHGAGIPVDCRSGGALVYENNETEVPGIFACGNVLQVHDLADFVSEESARTGAAAADYVLSGPCSAGEILHIVSGQNVHHTVPMKLRKSNMGSGVTLSVRVEKAFGVQSFLEVKQGGTLLARVPRACMSPGRIEQITLPRALLENLSLGGGPLTVSAQEEEVPLL